MSKTGGHPINLTGGGLSPSNYSEKDRVLHTVKKMFEPYFASIIIGVHIDKRGNINRTYSVPLIMLFLDKYSREQFLTYSASKEDPTSLSLKRMLSDETKLPYYVQKIVKRIWAACQEYGINVFEQRAISYTELNYKEDGAREIFRISLDGSKSNNQNVHDLTDYFFIPKQKKK